MKKIKLIAVGILLAAGVQAQQGSWYIGGIAGVGGKTDGETGTDYKTMRWNASPEFGTFLRDDIQLGFALNLSGSSEENDGNDIKEVMDFSPVIYCRKFWPIGDILSTFVGVNLNYISGSQTDYEYPDGEDAVSIDSDHSGFGANLNIGAAVALNDRFAVLTQYGLLGWSSVTHSMDVDGAEDYDVSEWGFNLNTLGPVFNVGLYYTIVPAK